MTVNSASHNSEPTLAELVNGLMSDAKLLVRQELALARHELYEEARKTKTAAASLGVGIGIAAVGGLLLIIMLVHLLRALTDWPIWTCYGIVGGIFVLLGGALLYSARRQISQIYVVPQQTVETMKENVRWFKRKTTLKRI
jgi:Putative Actinobacterial Holin-X, holin superfamily III